MKIHILPLAVLAIILVSQTFAFPSRNVTKVPKQSNKKIYVHLMPWFETRETSGNGQWGIHWTMANQNPDVIVGEGNKRQIASHYYPDIQPYGSGTSALIDYQIQTMKYAGVDGVLVDWPGTANAYDYPKNARNANDFINKLEAAGLDFAIVYEDHNLGLAQEGGFIGDILGQGRQDMEYLRNNYFNRGNYVKINGNPLLMTFGPQTLKAPSDWEFIFSTLSPKPTFLTLWYDDNLFDITSLTRVINRYQQQEAGNNAQGEYPWIYFDSFEGLRNFYNNRPLNVKFGVCYPGFNGFYNQGGWPGPDWTIPVSVQTFQQTLDLALQSDVQWIQAATWNDYGEGTMIEPTREFGNGFLNVLQNALKVPYGNRELGLIKELFVKRTENMGKLNVLQHLDQVYEALNNLDPDRAEQLLKSIPQ